MADVPLPMEQKFLRFLQKWDALVVKDGKSYESGEIGHSKSIWASFWQKRWKNLQNDQNWPFWANLSHLWWQNLPLRVILRCFDVKWFEKGWKTQNICWCSIPPPGMKIFEISPKMRHFGGKRWGKLWIGWNWAIPRSIWALFWGKRWKNLQNDQNWLFWANLSHFFGKIHHINRDSAEIFKFSSLLIIA